MFSFGDLSIRYKLLSAFLGIALLTSAFGYYFLVKTEELKQSMATANAYNREFNLALNVSFENAKLGTIARQYMLTNDPALPGKYDIAEADFTSDINKLQSANLNDADRQAVNQISDLSISIHSVQHQVISAIKNNQMDQAQALLDTAYYNKQSQLSGIIQDFVSNDSQGMLDITLQNSVATADLQAAVTTLLAFVIIAIVGISLAISGSLARSISRLARAADQISQGNLDVKADVTSRDEIGKLASDFNQMSMRLKDSYEKLEQRVLERTHELAKRDVELSEANASLKAANDRLKELDKMKTEFISIAAHELRTPIQPILGYAELAERERVKPEVALKVIKESAYRLRDLATDVLEASKIDGNRLVLKKEKFEINDLLSKIATEMQMKVRDGVHLVLDLAAPTEIVADRMRITQVITNLVGNSLKFTSSGTITLQTRINEPGGKLVINVIDTGKGIPAEILPDLFSKFSTRSLEISGESGTGLGLFICKGIVEAHDGTISGKNTDQGGAIFAISLPISTLTKSASSNSFSSTVLVSDA